MRQYQKMDESIPMIAPIEVPAFSPYTAGRNTTFNMKQSSNVENIFDQTPLPDKIESYASEYVETPLPVYTTSQDNGDLKNVLFSIFKMVFLFIGAFFAAKVITRSIKGKEYTQIAILSAVFILLAFLFEWSLIKK